ncbi:hypothetical protein C1H46_013864 [Malus baccata]|uniref:Uncharacterized protein n=1 Tax=Malus baccata TaxID=106549 RepID=A0A540MNY4_MALBA|nr:hypothetical protein C1H46_013864 [Malus baccata]
MDPQAFRQKFSNNRPGFWSHSPLKMNQLRQPAAAQPTRSPTFSPRGLKFRSPRRQPYSTIAAALHRPVAATHEASTRGSYHQTPAATTFESLGSRPPSTAFPATQLQLNPRPVSVTSFEFNLWWSRVSQIFSHEQTMVFVQP